eukprot:357445-Chlamydomonas_euryale.AAC.2
MPNGMLVSRCGMRWGRFYPRKLLCAHAPATHCATGMEWDGAASHQHAGVHACASPTLLSSTSTCGCAFADPTLLECMRHCATRKVCGRTRQPHTV